MIDKSRLGTVKANIAIEIVRACASVAHWENQDTAGRAYPTLLDPAEIANHAILLADTLVDEMNSEGWLDSTPDNTQGD